jgi:hypothetical protein
MKARRIILRNLEQAEYYSHIKASHCFKMVKDKTFLLLSDLEQWQSYSLIKREDLKLWTKFTTEQFKENFPNKPL